MSKEKALRKTEIQLLMRMRSKDCPCANSNRSHCFKKGAEAHRSCSCFLALQLSGGKHRVCASIALQVHYCIHFQSSNPRLGFAFCPIILIFSEMGTIDPLCFTLIQTLYCWTSALKCGCRIILSKLEFLCLVSFLIQTTSQSRSALQIVNKQTTEPWLFY